MKILKFENHTEITNDFLHKIRGIYDFKALNERYKDKKFIIIIVQTMKLKKKILILLLQVDVLN